MVSLSLLFQRAACGKPGEGAGPDAGGEDHQQEIAGSGSADVVEEDEIQNGLQTGLQCQHQRKTDDGFQDLCPPGSGSLKVDAALFDDEWVEVRDSVTATGAPVCILDDKKIPLWHAATLSMKVPQEMLPLAEKCYIERLSPKGGSAVGCKLKGDSVIAEISVLDSYALAVDTVSPVLKPLAEKQWAKNGRIVFSLADKGCGIESYKAALDGEWVLFEYSSKNNRLVCDLRREGVKRGSHTLKIVAKDKVGNETVYEKQIKY